MKQSEQINELATALSKAQGEIEGAVKDSTNPFFKQNYADLESVIQAIKAPLAKYGLSFSQPTDFDDDGREFVETMIMHSSGQWLKGRLLIKSKDNSPQAQGSGISYAKRYALQAILGVSSTDDDGNDAQGLNKAHRAHPTDSHQTNKNAPLLNEQKKSDSQPPKDAPLVRHPAKGVMSSDAQRRLIFKLSTNKGLTHDKLKELIKSKYNLDSSKDLTIGQASELIEYFQDKK